MKRKSIDGKARRSVAAACVAVGSVALCSAVLLAACSSAPTAQSGADAGTEDAVVTQNVSTLYAAATPSELAAMSDLVASATFLGTSEPFLVDPVGSGDPQFFTDYYFRVTEAYAGEVSPCTGPPDPPAAYADDPSVIAVRVLGGQGSLVATVNHNAPSFEAGGEYLLFLYTISNGANHNTEGSHYYLNTTGSEVWRLDETGEFVNEVTGEVLADALGVDDLAAALSALPLASDSDASDYLDDLERQYRDGSISKEVYDASVAQAELEDGSFARIMTPEEQSQWEREMAASTSVTAGVQ